MGNGIKVKTNKWTVFFESDGETTDFVFPDPDVKILDSNESDHDDDDDFQYSSTN